MAIQTGQILQQISAGISTKKVQPIQTGKVQVGRVVRGISTYDERIRQGYLSEIERQKAQIEAQNLEIERQNEELKASYDKVISDIKNMNVGDYTNYYYTIPENIRSLFESPQQIQERLIIEKQQRAQDTLNEIDRIYAIQYAKYQKYDELYNKTSDPETADNYDRLRFEASVYMDELNQAKAYATGDYNTSDVINFALDSYQAKVQRNEDLVAAGRLNKIEEAKQIEQYKIQGMEPVYKYPNTQRQELIGFTTAGTKVDTSSWYAPVIGSSIKTTQIPQTQLELGLSKQQVKGEGLNVLGEQTSEYYVNQFGQTISYKPQEKQYYIFPKTETKKSLFFQTTPFSKYDNPLANTIFTSRKTSPKEKLNINIIDIPLSQQRGTIGSPTAKIFSSIKVSNLPSQPLEEDILGVVSGIGDIFGKGVKKGAEDFFTIGLGQELTTDIYFNLPQEKRGTMYTNPSTLKLELPKPQKANVPTIFGSTANLLGGAASLAPELALWYYAAPAIAVPYIVRGTKTALAPSSTTIQRLGGVAEAGTSLAFGYGGKIAKLIPKELKTPISRTITITEKLKVPKQEAVLEVEQLNLVAQVGGETKYFYKIKTIKPEVAESTGQITKVYKQNILRDMFGLEPKLIYSGVPYKNKIAYNKAIEQLKLTGLTEAQARKQLRLTAPKYIESRVSGEAFAIFGEDIKPVTYLKVEQKVTPKIIKISGVKTRSFQPLEYFIKSRGIEAGAKKDIMFFKSLPEYTKTYLTKGLPYQKLKQLGKTTEVFEQLTGVKSLGEREFKSTVSDIGYARTYKPIELEAYKDISISRRISPKERKVSIGRSNVLVSNIEEPLIISYEDLPKVTKELKTGDITGLGLKKRGLTEQQKYIKNLGKEGTETILMQKPLKIIEEAKKSLIKEQSRISGELIKQQVPQVPILKQTKIKQIPIIKTKQVPKEITLGGIGETKFKDLTGMGKIKEDLTSGGKFKDLGILEGRFRTTLEPIEDTENKVKIIDIYKTKDYFKDLGKVKEPSKDKTQTRIRQPTQLKFKERQKQEVKQKQDIIQKIDTWAGGGTGTVTRIDIITDKGYKPPKPQFFKRAPTKRQAEVLSKAFTVLIRSKGKVQEIGKGLPYGKALKLGVEKSKSSLAQTFALREAGTTRLSDINYRVPANLFTQPKRTKTRITPITFVERRGTTLSYYPERKSIQQEKKIKQRKLKWL